MAAIVSGRMCPSDRRLDLEQDSQTAPGRRWPRPCLKLDGLNSIGLTAPRQRPGFATTMTRSKFVAIATGAFSLLLGIAYLLLVQFLDFRGEMLPAPILDESAAPTATPVAMTPVAMTLPHLAISGLFEPR